MEKKEKEISLGTRTIVTYLVGALVLFLGSYVAYYVYLYPSINKVGEVINVETVIDWSYDIVNQVPYVIETDAVYVNSGITHFSDLEDEFLLSFLMSNLSSNEYTKNSDCTDEFCFVIRTDTLSSKYKNYYGESLTEYPDIILFENSGVCELNSGLYNCTSNLTDTYSGKLSIIEYIEEDEEYFYIYESVLFVKDMKYEKTTNLSYSYISLSPVSSKSIDNLGYLESKSSILLESVFEAYYTKASVYKHTFIKSGENYYWVSSGVTNDLPL